MLIIPLVLALSWMESHHHAAIWSSSVNKASLGVSHECTGHGTCFMVIGHKSIAIDALLVAVASHCAQIHHDPLLRSSEKHKFVV